MLSPRRHPSAKIEKNRPFFFKIGLIIALGATLIAFEWRVYHIDKDKGLVDQVTEREEIEMTPATQFSRPTPPPPKPDKNNANKKISSIKQVRSIDDSDLDKKLPEPDFTYPGHDASLPPDEKVTEPVPFVVVEQPPKFPGGESALIKFLESKIKYPEMARGNDIKGAVKVGFTVDVDGKVKNVHVVRSSHEIFENEAVRVVKKLPDWEPGKQRGRKVPVVHEVVIRFEIR